MSTQRPNLKISNYTDDRWINPQRWEKPAQKEEKNKNQNASPPTRNHNSSPAREQSWMENECDEMTKITLQNVGNEKLP